jgi:Transcriptional regulatory protein, C terminal
MASLGQFCRKTVLALGAAPVADYVAVPVVANPVVVAGKRCGSTPIHDRSINVQIMRLRRKLETDPSSPRMIETERNIGYLFTPTVEKVDLR